MQFVRDLQDGCVKAPAKVIAVKNDFGGTVEGRPKPFTLPRTTPSGLPLARLPFRNRFDPRVCSVWAAPQATVTVPLSRIADLVRAIERTEGQRPGIALTGSHSHRRGLRSDALFKARQAVDRERKLLLEARPPHVLSDGTTVNASSFSESLRGFLILLASYLWTSELRYEFDKPSPERPRDYEPFGKAYLPVNVKAPFSEIFRTLLGPVEQRVFREMFADGVARARLFGLARPGATLADATRKLLPPGPKEGADDSVHSRQAAAFGSVPTWNDFVAHVLDSSHKGWGDILLVPLSKIIPLDRTTPGVALELRRIGFNAVFARDWRHMMLSIFSLARALNR